MLVGPRTGVPRTIGQVAPTQLAQEDPSTVGPKDYWALGLLAPSTLRPKDYWAVPNDYSLHIISSIILLLEIDVFLLG